MKKMTAILIPLLLILGFYLGKYLYFKPKYDSGEAAHNFTTKLIDGSEFSLHDMNGNYVLLDFWGSWCGPCRQENPGLVRLYKKYHGKKYKGADDFQMISVAIETDEKRWKAAIQKDGLIWPHHISEVERFKSPIVKGYGVREIPTKYLLNPDMEIISVNPSIEELDGMLAARLK